MYTIDINECTMGTDNCAAEATCTNTEGSFTCTCNQGYTGDGVACNGKYTHVILLLLCDFVL